MTNNELIDLMERGDLSEANEAFEAYRKVPRKEDLPRLLEAFETRSFHPRFKAELGRWDLVTVIGLIDCPEAKQFLRKVAASRTSHWVRYEAMRCLIELHDPDWRPGPDTPRKLRSDFYASLLAYEQHWRREIDIETFRSLGASKTKYPGDWWWWIKRYGDA